MVKPLPVAHLHDFTLEIFHSGVGAAVLAALPCVGWSVHVGQKRDFINPQGVEDDMHMDITAVVMPVSRFALYHPDFQQKRFPPVAR